MLRNPFAYNSAGAKGAATPEERAEEKELTAEKEMSQVRQASVQDLSAS